MRSNGWSEIQARSPKRRAGSRCRRLRSGPSRERGARPGGNVRPAVVRVQHGSRRSRIPLGRPPAQRHEVGGHGDGDVLRPGAAAPRRPRRRSRSRRGARRPTTTSYSTLFGAGLGSYGPIRLRGDRRARRLVERQQRERVRSGGHLRTVAAGNRRLAGGAGGDPGPARAQHELRRRVTGRTSCS